MFFTKSVTTLGIRSKTFTPAISKEILSYYLGVSIVSPSLLAMSSALLSDPGSLFGY
jgi:hypothetical protein